MYLVEGTTGLRPVAAGTVQTRLDRRQGPLHARPDHPWGAVVSLPQEPWEPWKGEAEW